jgi:hypothetical protein
MLHLTGQHNFRKILLLRDRIILSSVVNRKTCGKIIEHSYAEKSIGQIQIRTKKGVSFGLSSSFFVPAYVGSRGIFWRDESLREG